MAVAFSFALPTWLTGNSGSFSLEGVHYYCHWRVDDRRREDRLGGERVLREFRETQMASDDITPIMFSTKHYMYCYLLEFFFFLLRFIV
jgi:hypothetical protein